MGPGIRLASLKNRRNCFSNNPYWSLTRCLARSRISYPDALRRLRPTRPGGIINLSARLGDVVPVMLTPSRRDILCFGPLYLANDHPVQVSNACPDQLLFLQGRRHKISTASGGERGSIKRPFDGARLSVPIRATQAAKLSPLTKMLLTARRSGSISLPVVITLPHRL